MRTRLVVSFYLFLLQACSGSFDDEDKWSVEHIETIRPDVSP